ncbi:MULTISPECIES: DUF971 domain-containing protein [unclassified Schlesneria]|uniref:DUF971 domain-containing protein n=1 Tax=Schlesneria TaxID=656899 RepID=UPI002EDF4115
MTDIGPPQSLRALKDAGVFEITWADGRVYRPPFKLVRFECPCAQCVDEITGVRLLRPESIPDDIHPIELGFSGNYALKVVWSDQHGSGLFTWDRLHRICVTSQT